MAAPALTVMTAAEIASAVGGTVSGDPAIRVQAVAALDRATANHLSFFATAKYAEAFAETGAGIVLLTPEFAQAAGRCAARVVVAKPHDAIVSLLPHFYPPVILTAGVHTTAVIGKGTSVAASAQVDAYAVIGDGAIIGERAWIGAHVVIGEGASVGADSRLFAHVTMYPHCSVGDRTVIHSGSRIGSDGFGFIYSDGAHQKIPHVGRCIIGNDVEVGANCTLDRGSIDDTVVGDGTKLDNLVHVAHNVRIGRLCLLMAQVGIAGSARIEDGVILAGQVGISGHLTMGKGARIGAKSGVYNPVAPGDTWSGNPARPHREALRAQAALYKIAGFMKRLERLLAREKE